MKRVIRIIAIEGEDEWVDMVLRKSLLSTEKPLMLGKNKLEELLRAEADMEGFVKIEELLKDFMKGGDTLEITG